MSGVTRQQLLTASRSCDHRFSVPMVIDSHTLLVKGSPAGLDALTAFIKEHYNKDLTVETLLVQESSLPTGLVQDFPHPSSPEFANILNGPMVGLMGRLTGFIQKQKHAVFPVKSPHAIKTPFVSPFDGSYGDKTLVAQTRLIPSLGTPLFDDILDLLYGTTINLPAIKSSANFLINGTSDNSTLLLNSIKANHQLIPLKVTPPNKDFGKSMTKIVKLNCPY